MKTYPRQIVTTIINSTVDSIIEKKDERYARQFATQLERHAIRLRIVFGGRSLLGVERPEKQGDVTARCMDCEALFSISNAQFDRAIAMANGTDVQFPPCPKCHSASVEI